jgi:hypothetical protein
LITTSAHSHSFNEAGYRPVVLLANGSHGFLRARDSTYTTFDPPGSIFTAAGFPNMSNINPAGAVAGYYYDADGNTDVVLRYRDSTFAEFGVLGVAGSLAGINPAGAITDGYCDANGCPGFLRAPDGTITTFDPLGSISTGSTGINPTGTDPGCYEQANSSVEHGFVRAPDGTFTTIDGPSTTQPSVHATFTTFDPPGSTFTFPQTINPAGAITGWYLDALDLDHGFIRNP